MGKVFQFFLKEEFQLNVEVEIGKSPSYEYLSNHVGRQDPQMSAKISGQTFEKNFCTVSNYLPQDTCSLRRGNSIWIVEISGRHHLNQAIKVNGTGNNTHRCYV